jgi:tetratricopeptide (TPR) repeat protein/cellulose synthase/poly-beta-1,6-N-acetylglucosamine synthase-like glycosyltransferase
MPSKLAVRKVVILCSSAVALLYIVYRAVSTLNLTSPYAVFASLFLYIGEVYGVMTMLLFFLQVWDPTEPPQQPVLEGRTVDVFVPTYNEDPDLLRVTLQACVRMDYPHRTYLCDDGGTDARVNDAEKGPGARKRSDTLKAICAEVGAIYSTRPKNEHAKAGNLNYAFAKTDGEFIIIFDADHVPDPHFITRLLGYFADEKLAFVQTPHAFYNFDSFQARLNHNRASYWEEGQLFYHVIQPGRNRWNAPIFAGSAAMFRRKALEDVGYIAYETITEDMHTGLRMHAKGWKSLGISERMISGQAAQDVTTFHSQRLRWGEGNLSVLAHDNPLTIRGLTLGQRFCYFATMINWAGGLFKLPIYLTPLLMLVTGIPPVKEFTWLLASIMAAYMTVSILGVKYASNGYGSTWYSELFTMAGFWTQIRGTMRAMFLRKFQMFVVTQKRGRQSNSIWPFIRPQVLLMAVSVLALTWAWGRLWFCISDDYFKPVLASFWTFFHMMLAYLVVRRAYWPEDQRYSTRHHVHLPVRYEILNAPEGRRQGFGVTVDLNDLGVGFVAYEHLSEEAVLRLTLYGAGESITCEGEMKFVQELSRGSHDTPAPLTGFRYGVAFTNRSNPQSDALNLLCLHYAVPRLYAYYAHEHRSLDTSIKDRLARWFFRRRAGGRHDFHLPLFLHAGASGPDMPAVTEDVSRNAFSVLLRTELPPRAERAFTLVTPLGEVSGTARILRSVRRVYASRVYYLSVLEFLRLENQGRDALRVLFTPDARKRFRPVLTPSREPMTVPMNRPLSRALILAVPLVLVQFGAFRWVYRDDFFLRSFAKSGQSLSAEDTTRIDRIFKETMQQSYPSTDRLVLLGYALQRLDRPGELAEVTKRLAPRDRGNLDLQIALAQAFDQREEYDRAEAEYQRLLKAREAGSIPESRTEDLLLAAARCSVHAGHTDLAASRFRELLQSYPDKMEYRDEYAGVLLNSQKLQEAVQLYQGVEPDYEGRLLLVMIHTAAKDWNAAATEARALLKLRPGDPTAEGLLADVLNLQGNHHQARAIYERLLTANPSDLKVAVQLAHLSLWSKDYPEALARFQALVDQGLANPDVLRHYPELPKAYVNAAASASPIGDGQRKTVLTLYERSLTNDETDAAYLARLGWVLHRLQEYDKSAALLERALALDPTDPAIRRQLAGVLVALGKPGEALKLLEGQENSLDARVMLVDIYAAARNFTEATRACRALLDEHPDNQEIRLRLANLLSWNKEYSQSLALFDELVKADPNNPVYGVRRAEVTLWSGDHTRAVQRFEALLTADFDRPALWWSFVDAAAGAKELTEGQVHVVVAIADKTQLGEHKSSRVIEAFRQEGRELTEATFLTRLAWVLLEHAKDPGRAAPILDLAVAAQPKEPAHRKELAGVLAAAGRYAEALRLYDGLPLEWQDRLPLARIYAAAENFDAAVKQCRLVLDKQPLDKDAQRLLADVLSWSGQYAEALELLTRLTRAFPADLDLRRRQAEVTLWGGDYARALTMYQVLLNSNWEQPVLWQGFMDAAGRADQLTPEQAQIARRIAGQPIANEPRQVEFMARVAWVQYRHLNEKAAAQSLGQRAAGLRSQDPAVLARLAWVLFQMGDKASSETVLGQARALRPRDLSARKELAGVLTATQHLKEAREMFEEMARDYPWDAGVQGRLAQTTLWGGDPALALERFTKLLEMDFARRELWPSYVDAASAAKSLTPKQIELAARIADQPVPGQGSSEQAVFLSRLAWVFYREGDQTRAGLLLDKAVALQPSDAKVREELAGVLVAAGRSKQALPWIEELARANPGDAKLQVRLAEVTLWSGAAAGALEKMQGLLEANFEQQGLWASFVDAASAAGKGVMSPRQIDLTLRLADHPVPDAAPDKVLYQSRLAWVLYREGQKAKADALLDKALAQQPLDPKVRRELAGVLMAAGRSKEALAWLEELARDNPGDAGLQGQLAQATLWGGDPVLALSRLQQALTANFEQPDLWISYVDAASGMNKGTLTREQVQLALRIAERPVPDNASDKALYLSRLAWSLHREEEKDKAGELLDKAVAVGPKDPKVRRELAGVLTAAGRNEAALRLFQGLTLDLDDRFQLVVLHSAARRFAEAAKQCRLILEERPDDLRAQQWLADVSLWSNQFSEALSRYHKLLSTNFEQPSLWPKYMEAAARVDVLEADQVRTAAKIIERDSDAKDAVYLARMALVLHRHVEAKTSLPILSVEMLGLMATPTAPGPLLVATAAAVERGRPRQSKELLLRAVNSRPKDPTVLARLAWVIHQMGDTVQAAQVIDEAVALRPPEPAVRREVGDVLVATGRWEVALPWFEELAAADLKDLELQARLAQVTVWSGNYVKGLGRLAVLLEADFEQRSLWQTYVDAAASVPAMTEDQTKLAVRIAEAPIPVEGDTARVLFLSRLAWALLREGQRTRTEAWHGKADSLLDQALKLRPNDPRVRIELAGVLGAARRFSEALALYEDLSRIYPEDLELRIRLAEMTLWSGSFARAVDRFEQLLQGNFQQPRLWRNFVDAASSAPALTAAQKRLALRIADQPLPFNDPADEAAFLSRLAWIQVRDEDKTKPGEGFLKAAVLLDKAVALDPRDPKVRRELAGVLAAAGKNEAGLRLYQGLTLDLEDRFQLVALHAAAGQFADAAKQCRAILEQKPNDPRARQWLAKVTLWGGDSSGGLEQLEVLLKEDFRQPELWTCYVDAAARAKQMTRSQIQLAVLIAGQPVKDQSEPVLFLSRLAWALQREGKVAKDDALMSRARALLDQALVLQPRKPKERRELAGVLAAVGKNKQALDLLAGLETLEPADRALLASLYAAEKNFDAAEKEARKVVEHNPGDAEARYQLACVLSWNKKYPEATQIFEALAQTNPEDARIPVRLAEVASWSGEYETALERYEKLFEKDGQQPALWSGYVDAAAAVKSLPSEPHKRIALQIHEQVSVKPPKDAVFLSRFAWVLRRLDEPKKGVVLLKQALELEPKSREIRTQLAEALSAAKEYAEAEKHYRILLQTDPARRP